MVQIAGNFIPGQVVTRVAKRNGTPQVISAPNQAGSRFRRMVVLVDQGTASTSEVLAAALHEKAHARLLEHRPLEIRAFKP
jgi:C-terminal processing protease CtpA/Prc